MLRALAHYWRINLAVVLGAAVATAVLSGALLVGDSVRGSLRDLTLDRLGRIDSALVAQRFFGAALAERLSARAERDGQLDAVAPAILLRGSAVHTGSGARASDIAVVGVSAPFAAMFDTQGIDFSPGEGQIFPSVVLNATLAREIGAESGDTLLLNFGRFSPVPRDTLMGSKDPDDVLESLRVTVVATIPDRGLGHFGLAPNQQSPLNAYVALPRLQRALEQPDRVNALFATHRGPDDDPGRLLADVVELDDVGLTVRQGADRFTIESREFVLRPNLDQAIRDVAADLGAPLLGVQSYVVNGMRVGERFLPYSMVAALDPLPGADWSSLRLADGTQVERIAADEILLNSWAAKDLQAARGDTITLEFFVVGPREELTVDETRLRVGGVVKLEGLGADRSLTPDYPGVQDADDISDWDPPFPVELSLIREEDEAYWDEFGAAPKAFVSADTGRRLWSTRFGSSTSARLGAAPGLDLEQTAERFRQGLLRRLPPAAFGLEFRPVKQEGLRAAVGATDFAGLFIGFSLFLIVSSALLVGLLFGLGVEQRAGELGLRLAVGYPVRSVRRQLLAEGGLLAACGALLGLAGGVGYAALMMAGLRTIWRPAVGSSALFLHVEPLSLALGWAIAVLVIGFAIALAVRRLRRVPPPALLAGSLRSPARRRPPRLARWLAWGGLTLAVAILAYAVATGSTASPGLAFGSGALLLVAGLAFFALWCRGARRRRTLTAGSFAGLLGMAARNTSWNPGRSVLSVALVGCACFMIVAVGANRQEFGDELTRRDSGSGGFALVAESDVPLHQDLNRSAARLDLGFASGSPEELEEVEFVSFRFLPGDDTSCLNLYQPEKPRVLGVPAEMIRRGGFRFQGTLDLPPGAENPWELLQQPLEPGVIPAFGDYNSMMWILHLGLGQDLPLVDEYGQTIRLRLVGMLQGTVFQSELLVAEEAFLRHFPSRTGYSYFLIQAPLERAGAVGHLLEGTLGRYGFDVTTTGDRLARYKVVEHTYLSTFQTLGGLGLLLGTVGLAVILVRSVIERRGELATLRAFGFRRTSLAWLVIAENAFVLLVGMSVGTVAALVAVAPRMASLHVPWASLLVTLALILAVGMLSSVAAVIGALRVPLLPALKAEV